MGVYWRSPRSRVTATSNPPRSHKERGSPFSVMCRQASGAKCANRPRRLMAAWVCRGGCQCRQLRVWSVGARQPMEPDFKEGDLLIVDPDEAPKAGDFVDRQERQRRGHLQKYLPRGGPTTAALASRSWCPSMTTMKP